MNENLVRIRALLWYLIIVYRSHNNKNDHLTRPWERARVSTHEYLHTITLIVLINNYCYGKSQVRITRDFLVDLHNYGTEFTYFQIFTRKLSISVTIHDATKSWIICLKKKPDGPLPSNFQFLMKRTQQKTLRADN